MPELITCTRVFNRDFEPLSHFIDQASLLGEVRVVVNSNKDERDTLSFLRQHYPTVGLDNPTGDNLTAGLNIAFWQSVERNVPFILFASDGFPPQKDQVNALLAEMDDQTLVAGARFGEHRFEPGEHEIDGLTTPWNTFAIWNVDLLRTWAGGFPVSGTYPQNPALGGVEEIDAIVTAQTNALATGSQLTAKLVEVPGFYESWNMNGWTKEQVEKHEAKMASKVSRPQARDLPTGTVLHIAH